MIPINITSPVRQITQIKIEQEVGDVERFYLGLHIGQAIVDGIRSQIFGPLRIFLHDTMLDNLKKTKRQKISSFFKNYLSL